MVFSSLEFLFRFIPLFFIAYFITKPAYRNVTLLVGSLFFYAFGEPVYILLMVLSIFVNHVAAGKIYQQKILEMRTGRSTHNVQKRYLVLSLLYDFGILVIFKYFNFFGENLNALFGSKIFPEINLVMPIGISFYTFQIVSYMIDVYREKYAAENNVIDFAAYISMFPQLIAGPIVCYDEVRDDLKHRRVNFGRIESGVTLFIVGLAYKVLLANKIMSLWNEVLTMGPRGINAPIAWLGSWGFSMQLYFDFFGYSIMAIGLGKILGFKFPTNFKNPYCAKSATEFWRKWHITLGRWFREYVYIPLGGNRKGTFFLIFNTLIVWTLTGLWHGAAWNFVLWGLFFFVLLMLEKFFYLDKLNAKPLVGHIYMLVVIPVSWTIFNISDMKLLGQYLRKMFFLPVEGTLDLNYGTIFWDIFGRYWWLLLICVIFCTPYPMRIIKSFYKHWLFKIIMLVVFWYCVYQLVKGGSNPFLYLRF